MVCSSQTMAIIYNLLSRWAFCLVASTSDSGYASSVADEAPFASTSNWVPCTPFSPYPTTSPTCTGYFDSCLGSTSEVSTPSTASDSSDSPEWSTQGALQRRHSAQEPPTPGLQTGVPVEAPLERHLSRSTLTRRHSLSNLADATTPPNYLRRQRTICPREEEGQEGLPDYSCEIHLEGTYSRKMEQSAPNLMANDRSWSHTYMVVHGTTLKLYKYHPSTHPIDDPSPATQPSQSRHHAKPRRHSNVLLASYSLQNAQCGLAADYVKKPFVVRVRVQGQQMLFKCKDLPACVDLIETLQLGINVALDLDDRVLPTFITLPRRRRRAAPTTTAPATNAEAPTPATAENATTVG